MRKALVLAATALALSAGAASAQVPGYNYYGATVPLYGYAAPGYGYGPTVRLYTAPAYAAPLVGPGYDAPWDYAPGGREWMIEKGW